MKKEELVRLGIAEDIAQQIIVMHGKDIENFKNQIATLEPEVATLKTQLSDASKTIDGFKKLDVEGIKAAADEWKTKYDQSVKDGEAKVAQLQFDHALSGALTEAKAKNPIAVKALLNVADLKLAKDGSIVGLAEQLEKLKADEHSNFLFDVEAGETETETDSQKINAGSTSNNPPAPRIVAPTKSKSVLQQAVDPVVRAARLAAGLPAEPSGDNK